MKKLATILATAIIAGTGGAAAAHTVDRHAPYLLDVQGTARDGFAITWQNGTVSHWPTRSEIITECGAYRLKVDRVRCKVRANVTLRWVGITKRSINHAR